VIATMMLPGSGSPPGRLGRLACTYVRWHARGGSFGDSGWVWLVRSVVVLVLAVLFVVAIAQDEQVCGDETVVLDADLPPDVSFGPVVGVLLWWLFAIVLAALAMRRVIAVGRRRSRWIYPNWRRRIQGALAATTGKVLLLLVLAVLLLLTAADVCEEPGWFALPASFALLAGLLLVVFGSAVVTEAGWVGFALVVVVDLLTAALLAGWAVLDPGDDRTVVIGVVAFTIHAGCTAAACRWSFVVSGIPGVQPDDRAKAGETGRALCALWVLLLIASLVVLFDEDLVASALTILTSPVVVALTLGALAVTIGGGHTKYVEGREAALRRVRDRRASGRRLLDRRVDLIPRIAARMVVACGPLNTRALTAGINRVADFRLGDRQVRRELGRSPLLRHDRSGDEWWLAGPADLGRYGWPTDRALQQAVATSGRHEFDRPGMAELLIDAGYQGFDPGDHALDRHPLVRVTGRGPVRRWTVLPAGPAAAPQPEHGKHHR
jgi:hypothetical protein